MSSTEDLQLFQGPADGLTIFAVFSAEDNDQQQFIVTHNLDVSTGFENFELGYDTGNQDGAGNFGLHRGAFEATIAPPGTVQNGELALFSVTVQPTGNPPANVEIRKNGGLTGVATDNSGWLAAGQYRTDLAPLDVGARYDLSAPNLDGFHRGEIAEIVIYRGNLSVADRQAIENALATKYGLTLTVIDSDGDTVPDVDDADPLDPQSCQDTDGDSCDDCAAQLNGSGPDPSNDGIDTDADMICNAGDVDDDNDGIFDFADIDAFDPFVCIDSDNDNCDDCTNGQDQFGPLPDNLPDDDGVDTDGDGLCDAGDPPTDDADGDGVEDSIDNCPVIPNPGQEDGNGDGFGDACVSADIRVRPGTSLGDFVDIGLGTFLGRNLTVGDNSDIGPNNFLGIGATIGSDVTTGDGVRVFRDAFVGDRSSLGDGTRVGRAVFLGADSTVGDNTRIFSGASLGNGTRLGSGVTIGRDVTSGVALLAGDDVRISAGVQLGDFVDVNSDTSIFRDVSIGDFARIGSRVQINALSQFGDNIFIGDDARIGRNLVAGDFVIIGAGTNIGRNVNLPAQTVVPDGVVIPANSVVSQLDSDGDGWFDDIEVFAGTDPDDSEDLPPFPTLPGSPLFIGNVMIENTSRTSVTTSWATNLPADSQLQGVLFESDPAVVIISPVSDSLRVVHSAILEGLTPNTVYQIRVVSVAPSGEVSRSSAVTFRTRR